MVFRGEGKWGKLERGLFLSLSLSLLTHSLIALLALASLLISQEQREVSELKGKTLSRSMEMSWYVIDAL
eukprot:1189686-Amorphochlora_amoeboformis.AAC.1